MPDHDDRIAELEAKLSGANARASVAERELQTLRAGHTKTVEYDLSPAMTETAIRDKLVELGWTPPARAPAPRYTCIGKGGEYEMLGTARGAGAVRHLDTLRIYRSTKGGGLFFRTVDDFDARMQLIQPGDNHGS